MVARRSTSHVTVDVSSFYKSMLKTTENKLSVKWKEGQDGFTIGLCRRKTAFQ